MPTMLIARARPSMALRSLSSFIAKSAASKILSNCQIRDTKWEVLASSILDHAHNNAFQRDSIAVSHLLQSTQKLRHDNFAPE